MVNKERRIIKWDDRPADPILDLRNSLVTIGHSAADSWRLAAWEEGGEGLASPMPEPFLVHTSLVDLAVIVAEDAVTEIQLSGRAHRSAATDFECRVARELTEYCDGKRKRFDFPVCARGTPFQEAVWHELRTIPYGQTRTYGKVAEAVGRRDGARAVGMANHHNPVPIVIPCHRVVAAGGKLGGFGGGVDLKRRLLRLEEAHTPPLMVV